jgi:hypothetical protein
MSSGEPSAAPAQPRPTEARARSLIKIGACTSAAGIALAVTGDNDVSRWLTVIGIVLLVWGLHRFGRLGSDRASERSAAT